MPVSEAKKAATVRYDKKSYDRIMLRLRKNDEMSKETIQIHAEKAGESLNKYILNAIESRIKSEK